MDPNLTCYGYVDVTHEFVCPLEADYDPLDPGNILWPRNSTPLKPPAYTDGTIPVFDETNNKWTVLPDYRGMYGYDPDGNMVLIERAGDPATFTPPLTKTPPVVDPEPVDPNIAARTSKVEFFRRCTDDEAAQFVADLTEASPKLKAIFDAVSYLVPGTEEYPQLRAAVEARVGTDRANELLAPSND